MAVTGYHRKYVIQVLNHPPKRKKRRKRTSQTKYQGPVRAALDQVWRTANCICGKRLTPVLPLLRRLLVNCTMSSTTWRGTRGTGSGRCCPERFETLFSCNG